jgi:deoxyribonuclease V
LRDQVIPCGALPAPRRIAGVDVGFAAGGTLAVGAACLFSFPDLQCLEIAQAELPVRFPYIPGLLSFRELPVLLAALAQLSEAPDLILCDGHGLAHPRRFGIACHLGVCLDRPAVGVGKSLLLGEHGPLPTARGARAALWDRGEEVGAVLRTRAGVRPVYVSVGHRIDLLRAVELILACTPRFRLPEPIHTADRLASRRGPPPPTQRIEREGPG